MSKECLNALEMSKAEDKVTEFFNNADAVQAEEGAWYYSESSVNSELLSIYAELAKANERVKELELIIAAITHANETGYVDDVCFVKDWGSICNETKSLLSKFTIEQQIEALAHVLSSYKTQKFCPTNYAIQAFNDGVAHLWAHIVNCELQLRKEQDSE